MKAMRNLHRVIPVALALISSLVSTSCLVSRRVIKRQGKPATVSQTLLVASRDDLNQRIAKLYNAINSFQTTVDMKPSIGSVYKGQITEFKDVRAYVLFRKPAEIRIIGLYPVVRSTAFDMVSKGNEFRIFLPSKNKFVEGSNSAPANSSNKLENLRPEAFLSAMLIRPADTSTETPVLEDATDEDNALYVLHFMTTGPDGKPILARNVWFDRLDLSIVRQKAFDPSGVIVSDTRYSKWDSYNGVLFPSSIDINRPKDGYGVVMTVVKMEMNTSLPEEKFVLNQPEGTQLQIIGAQSR